MNLRPFLSELKLKQSFTSLKIHDANIRILLVTWECYMRKEHINPSMSMVTPNSLVLMNLTGYPQILGARKKRVNVLH